MATIRVTAIEHGSTAWRAAVELRWETLRKPLGMSFTQEQLDSERDALLYAAYRVDGANEQLVATALFIPLDTARVQLRQMTVAPAMQGHGVGRALLEYMEADAVTRGFVEVIAEARETALPFFAALGYRPSGETYEHVGLPHRMISKRL
jgi:GNAT superfamily N-acetyltransferase